MYSRADQLSMNYSSSHCMTKINTSGCCAFSSTISVCELMSLNILALPPEEYKSLIYLSIPGLTALPSLQPSFLICLSSADLISSAQVTMLRSPSPSRIRPCCSQHRWREDILYGVCTSGHPPHFGHVPECW